ncbi:glutathione S-transferase 1-like isoform X2 [Dermacentor andersoni]|uniref:glutathione S-transferase 1-like isoform X2 n=1 Tax=Dermacentor andersoni TaxID=34620 RepID=UPI003B3AB71D
MAIELYTFEWSISPTQVQMLARHIGLDIKLHVLNIDKSESQSEEYRKLNPLGLVPTIVEEDFVLTESSAICHYLLNKYAPYSELYPKDLRRRARVDEIVEKIGSYVYPRIASFYVQNACFKNLKKPTAELLQHLEEEVIVTLERLVGESKFAVGVSVTLADLCLAAHIASIVPCYFYRSEKFPRLTTYYETVRAALPYFDEICQPGIDLRNKMWEMAK